MTGGPGQPPAGRGAPPRERLLRAARLFYTEGIRAVGINRVLDEADAPIMSLYRLYGSKEGLVEAYLADADERTRARFDAVDVPGRSGRAKVLAVFDVLAGVVAADDYRGCMFINVAVEMADREHPFTVLAAAHKEHARERFARFLAEAGIAGPEPLAAQLVMLMDGVYVRAQMRDSDAPAEARAAAAALLDAALAGRDVPVSTPPR